MIKTDGRVYVVSAPSGTGKTTLNRRLVKTHADILMSVSYTTRARRAAEIDGVHYHYVSQTDFKARIAAGEMLEYAEVFGNFYGTSVAEIDRIQSLGKIPLLEVDVQGWQQAKTKLTNAQSIFIVPPSIEALWSRLEKRGTEAEDVRWRRLMTAKDEIEHGHIYDYFIINEDVESAYRELSEIVVGGKPGRTANAAGRAACQLLLQEFDREPWLADLKKRLGAPK